jgi:RNA polymerase sigma-70 factor (ECF subfamily)
MLDEPVDRRAFLRAFLQEHAAQLQAIIRAYVLRGGVAYGDAAQTVAQEIFQDAVLEALSHADRLDPNIQPRAWFLSIAINLIKRRRADEAKRSRREVLLGDVSAGLPEEQTEGELFAGLARAFAPGPEQIVVSREQAQEILGLVSSSDARVLRLAVVQGLNTELLARELGVRPTAARVRLHRAIHRLRTAWHLRETQEKGGMPDA